MTPRQLKQLVEKEGMVEIFGSQILPEKVFEASGHLQNFNDPIVQCTKCNSLHRADKLIEVHSKDIVPESLGTAELDKLIKKHAVKCPKCKGSDFSTVKKFNMMMKVDIGATGDVPCYLRPETCQSIFLDFPRLYKTMRRNLPLGIAQAGKSFRNEISPRNSLIREREIGQMEVEVFFDPDKIDEIPNFKEVENYKLNLMLLKKKTAEVSCKDAVKKKIVSGRLVAYYLARIQQLYESFGIPVSKMRLRELDKDEKAFYARETWDFEAETDLGWVELVACNYRTDFDLKRHAEFSGKKLSVKEDNEEFVPHVFEISAGIDRTFYVLIDHAFRKEKRGPEERIYLDLNPRIAPFLAGVFPLVKKDGLQEKAREVFDLLNEYEFDAFFDEKGSIGKRYLRSANSGTPFAITIDYDSLDYSIVFVDNCHDQQKQRSMSSSEVAGYV